MSNALKIYIFSFFQMSIVIIPVAVPFYSTLGLSMAAIFQLQAIFGLIVVLCEMPTAYAADLWGRKKTLVAGSVFLGIGFTYLIWARGFADVVITEVAAGIGVSLISGADIAMLYDGVAQGEANSRRRVLSNKQLAELSGESFAALLGGYLVTYSFKAVLIANAVLFWVPLVIALTFDEPAYERLPAGRHRENMRAILAHLLQSGDAVFRLAFLNNVIGGLSTVIAVWLLQRYWQLDHVPLSAFGFLWAGFNLTTGLAGKIAHRLEQGLGVTVCLAFIALFPIAGYIGMGFLGGFLGIACGVFFYIGRGLNYVVLSDMVNWRTPSQMRASVNSARSFCFRLAFAFSGPGVGWAVDRYGMRPVLLFLAASFSVILSLTMVPLIAAVRRAGLGVIPEAK